MTLDLDHRPLDFNNLTWNNIPCQITTDEDYLDDISLSSLIENISIGTNTVTNRFEDEIGVAP